MASDQAPIILYLLQNLNSSSSFFFLLLLSLLLGKANVLLCFVGVTIVQHPYIYGILALIVTIKQIRHLFVNMKHQEHPEAKAEAGARVQLN